MGGSARTWRSASGHRRGDDGGRTACCKGAYEDRAQRIVGHRLLEQADQMQTMRTGFGGNPSEFRAPEGAEYGNGNPWGFGGESSQELEAVHLRYVERAQDECDRAGMRGNLIERLGAAGFEHA